MWADVLDQPRVDWLVVTLRQQGITGAAEIRAVLERLAARERRKRAAVALWQRAKGRQVA